MRILTALLMSMAVTAVLSLASCKDYGDDLADLGQRVEVLESSLQENSKTDSLLTQARAIINLIEGSDTITSIVKNADGSYTLTFKKLGVVTLKDGTNGADATGANLGIVQDTDGHYYWTLDGVIIVDSSGNKVWAGGLTPHVRLNDEGYWEIYNETTGQWENTGVKGSGNLDTVISIVDDGNGNVTITLNFGNGNLVYTFNYKL